MEEEVKYTISEICKSKELLDQCINGRIDYLKQEKAEKLKEVLRAKYQSDKVSEEMENLGGLVGRGRGRGPRKREGQEEQKEDGQNEAVDNTANDTPAN